jgi:hypothetical protein
MHTAKLLHLGCTTTQRVEGAHANIKKALRNVVSIPVAMQILDPWLQQQVLVIFNALLMATKLNNA